MFAEALKFLKDHLNPPEAVVELHDGSGRSYLFDYSDEEYTEITRYTARKRGVSNIESLAAMVIEEARRAALDVAPGAASGRRAGEWMTVVFNGTGAQFHLDDRDGRTVFTYDRQLSPQWALLTGHAGRPMDHASLVRLLQGLKPSIVEFPTVFQAYRKVSFDAGVAIESAPTLEDGRAGGSYRVAVQVGGRNAQAALPQQFLLRLPFARGSEKVYDIEAEVDIQLVEKPDKPKALAFTLLLPDRPHIEEAAVSDEVKWFRQEVQSLSRLSVLEDY